MDATLILIDSDAELLRARALVDEAMEFERSNRRRSARGASGLDRRVRGNEMAAAAAERRRFDPPPDGSARPHAS